jgi:DNA-binding XRE family transcriptional regulator
MKTIPLHGKKAAGRVAIVDDEDYDLVMRYRWNVQENTKPGQRSGPYARTNLPDKRPGGRYRQRALFMHNLIADYPKPDHIDGNGLNNQRSNLRPATTAQNIVNARRKPSNATSRYAGVSRVSSGRKWNARITCERTILSLGYYADEEEAALAYDKAARELYGDYARLNFPEGDGDRYRAREMSPLEIRAMLDRVNPRRLREEAGIRPGTVVRALGISRSTLSYLERESCVPNSSAGLRWARFVAGLERHAEVTAELWRAA